MFDILTIIAFILGFLIIVQIILFISLKLILLYLKKILWPELKEGNTVNQIFYLWVLVKDRKFDLLCMWKMRFLLWSECEIEVFIFQIDRYSCNITACMNLK
jgi:hypothetical protein